MKINRFIGVIICLTVMSVAVTGCTGFLEGSVVYVSEHVQAPVVNPPVPQLSVSGLDEIRELLPALITAHEESTILQYQGVENELIREEIIQIADEILRTNPIAAFAVANIDITATQIVTYYEIVIDIEFQKTAEQVSSIVSASTQRYMTTQMLEIMSRYTDEAVFYTNMLLDDEEIKTQIAEIYYQNPRRLVVMPYVTSEIFGQNDTDTEDIYRIYQIRFGYTEDTDTLRGMRDSLLSSVRRNAGRADGDTDGEILLSLVSNLTAAAVYDEGTAGIIAMHGVQNFAATAYGALVQGSAVGEGFAMAFKALCDELRLECVVVLGYMDDRYHAWNIINLEGDYYHIDTAMCAFIGTEAGFLLRDEDLEELYQWDKQSTPRCDGPLTLKDLLPDTDTADPDAATDPNNQTEP